jgi:hypothetical protein
MRLFAKTFNVFLALSLRLRKERRCSLKGSVVKKSKRERDERRETLVDFLDYWQLGSFF